LFLARFVDKIGAEFFDACPPVASAFGSKVLEGKILVVHVNSNLGALEKRAILFLSFDA
jgi:hypothetical protein